MEPDAYTAWCAEHGCEHAHCKLQCEHPQPFRVADGRLLCGACWHKYGVVTEMVPCVPGKGGCS